METAQAPRAVAAFKPGLTAAEGRAVAEAFSSGWTGTGVYVRSFESRLARVTQVPHAVATTSGTAALHLALRVLELDGAEVITTALTSAAVNHAVLYNRAAPVFCDVEPDTGNIDPRLAARLVTPRTRAILAVHFNGHPCDWDALTELARERGLALVEDAGGAIPGEGAYRGRPLGSLGDLGCFSFGRKNFTTLDGGAVVCRKGAWASRLKRLRNLGQAESASPAERERTPRGITELGYPYRMNDLTAVLGLSQFARRDEIIARLEALDSLYREGLKGLTWLEPPVEKQWARRSLSCFAVRLRGARKEALRAFLSGRGIGTDDWLVPNNLYTLYKPYRRPLPMAERLASELVYLPFYPGLSDEEAGRVVEGVRAFRS